VVDQSHCRRWGLHECELCDMRGRRARTSTPLSDRTPAGMCRNRIVKALTHSWYYVMAKGTTPDGRTEDGYNKCPRSARAYPSTVDRNKILTLQEGQENNEPWSQTKATRNFVYFL
jgi:hypothetical protein